MFHVCKFVNSPDGNKSFEFYSVIERVNCILNHCRAGLGVLIGRYSSGGKLFSEAINTPSKNPAASVFQAFHDHTFQICFNAYFYYIFLDLIVCLIVCLIDCFVDYLVDLFSRLFSRLFNRLFSCLFSRLFNRLFYRQLFLEHFSASIVRTSIERDDGVPVDKYVDFVGIGQIPKLLETEATG